MPLSEGSERAAWDNLLRQSHMIDVESDLLGVMAEAQAEGALPTPDAEPDPEDEKLDLTPFSGVGLTWEGAVADLDGVWGRRGRRSSPLPTEQ